MGPERICPKCQKSFWDVESTCPDDGSRLVVVGRVEDARVGQVIDVKFTIRGLLGKGGMGAVYRAMQHSMGREVAIKLLHRSFSDDSTVVRRFLQEAKAASRLSHPNVITVFDFGQTEQGELYLVMELLQGATLSVALHEEKPFEPRRAVAIMSQVCDALHHAHEQDLVHRDLKPDNIFVVQGAGHMGEFVKVLDFGIAKLKSVEGSESITSTGTVCGTPAYMSPEQATGQDIDRRSDIYSMGVVLYEMLAGLRPFRGETPVALLVSHASEVPTPIRGTGLGAQVPEALERVVMQTLAKRPADRPPTALALRSMLLAALEGGAPSVRRPSTAVDPQANPTEDTAAAMPSAEVAVPSGTSTADAIARMLPGPSPRRRIALAAVVAGLAVAGVAWALWPPSPPATAEAQPAAPAATAAPTTPLPVARPAVARYEPAEGASATRRPMETTPTVPAAPALPATIHVVSSPPGAAVHAGTEVLGKTPCDVARPKPGKPVDLTLRMAGYTAKTVHVGADQAGELSVELARSAARPVARPLNKIPIVE